MVRWANLQVHLLACTCTWLVHVQATLPWEIQKSHFRQYYSYILQIIYVISEENKLLLPYPAHLKNVTVATLVGILKRVIVSPVVYPPFIEIAELARSLCHN